MIDPTSDSDFSVLVADDLFPEQDPGHLCYSVPDAPSSVQAGTNATLQLRYTAQFDNPDNETFFACADITYVAANTFSHTIPCFNVSVGDDGNTSVGTGVIGGHTPTVVPDDHSSLAPAASSSPAPSQNSSAISGGAIAGIVIGVVIGAGLLLGAAFFGLRRYRRKVKRENAVALRMNELTNPAKSTTSSTTGGQ
jgi:hypothetical protein